MEREKKKGKYGEEEGERERLLSATGREKTKGRSQDASCWY